MRFNAGLTKFRAASANLLSNAVARQLPRPSGQKPLFFAVMRPYITLPPEASEPVKVETLRTPPRVRAVLELIAPQVHEGDHETTVQILRTGSPDSLAVELVRLFIYLETNNLVNQFTDITGCFVDLSISANVMDFLRCTGFLTKANINWLGRLTDPTSQAFLRRLLYHSIFDGNSLDILELLVPGHFNINGSVHIQGDYQSSKLDDKCLFADGKEIRTKHQYGVYYPQTLLQCSCLLGNINAVRFLLDLGVDPYDTSGRPREFSPLECAASLKHHDRATIIADLLLSKQTCCSSVFRKESIEVALRLVVSQANTTLVSRLLSERKTLGHETICSQYFTIAAGSGRCDMINLLVGIARRDEDGLVTLPEDILFTAIENHGTAWNRMEMVKYFLDLGADPTALRVSRDGVPNCILCHCLGKFSRGVLDLAEILRKHGCPPDRLKSTCERHNQTPALQAAVSTGDLRLVEFFLDWGVDVDFWIKGSNAITPAYEDRACGDDAFESAESVKGRSLLLTALEHQQIGIAKMLLKRNPRLSLHGGEQKLAMANGDDTELVIMLLQAGSANLDGWKDFLEQAIRRRNLKSIELLLSMGTDNHGALDPKTILRASLITGDYKKAYELIAICGYESRVLFEAVLESKRAKEYHKVVERLLEARPNTSNDDFEVSAIACAAIYHDIYLIGVLVKSFGQGPWVARFPDLFIPDSNWRFQPSSDVWTRQMHILEFVEHRGQESWNTADADIRSLLEVGVPANGMQLGRTSNLAAETLKQLIAAGAELDPWILLQAVGDNQLAHTEALFESKITLDSMEIQPACSRSAVQEAVEGGSLEMLRMLLHYGADVNGPAACCFGATCLQIAAGSGNIGLVRFLLDKGARVNGKRSLLFGRTAIEVAAENGRLDVLKLLLLQEQPLFHTAAERYQFIRAAKFAENRGHASIVQMLRQHIEWDSHDQELFDGLPDVFGHIHLDDMTQRMLESEKRVPGYWSDIEEDCRWAGFEDAYDIDGIKEWIGERIGEPDEWTGTISELRTDEGSDYIWEDINLLDAGQQQIELRSSQERSAQLVPVDDGMHDAVDSPESMCGDPIDEQATSQSNELSLNPEWGQQATALAPQAFRCKDKVPAWIDNLAAEDEILEVLQRRPAIQNVSREPGMVLGEVPDGMRDIDHVTDDAVDQNLADNSSEGEQVQHFDWSFWDDEGIGRVGSLLMETQGMRP